MPRPTIPPSGKCPQNRSQCNLECKYNQFVRGDLEIHSWELKCLDCGYRETIGFRSDDEEVDFGSGVQAICPFCGKVDAMPGKNPCG
jgi:hypothetical protein